MELSLNNCQAIGGGGGAALGAEPSGQLGWGPPQHPRASRGVLASVSSISQDPEGATSQKRERARRWSGAMPGQ